MSNTKWLTDGRFAQIQIKVCLDHTRIFSTMERAESFVMETAQPGDMTIIVLAPCGGFVPVNLATDDVISGKFA